MVDLTKNFFRIFFSKFSFTHTLYFSHFLSRNDNFLIFRLKVVKYGIMGRLFRVFLLYLQYEKVLTIKIDMNL